MGYFDRDEWNMNYSPPGDALICFNLNTWMSKYIYYKVWVKLLSAAALLKFGSG